MRDRNHSGESVEIARQKFAATDAWELVHRANEAVGRKTETVLEGSGTEKSVFKHGRNSEPCCGESAWFPHPKKSRFLHCKATAVSEARR